MSSATTFDIKVQNAVFNLENPAFCSYLLCTSLLVLKMMGVTLLTIYQRFKNKAFICQEDAEWLKGEIVQNDSVERVRRAFQNDLENIPAFLFISLAYLWTQPALWFIHLLFIIFTLARYLHTIVYTLVIMPQPTRALLWLVGFLVTGYMAIHTGLHVFIHMLS